MAYKVSPGVSPSSVYIKIAKWQLVLRAFIQSVNVNDQYSRTSMARTLMARIPRLFQTRSLVPWKQSHSCRFRIIKGDSFYRK